MRASTARVCLHSLDALTRETERERERERPAGCASLRMNVSFLMALCTVRVRQRRLGDKLSGLDLVARYLSTSLLFPRLESNQRIPFSRQYTGYISVVAISTRIPRTRGPYYSFVQNIINIDEHPFRAIKSPYSKYEHLSNFISFFFFLFVRDQILAFSLLLLLDSVLTLLTIINRICNKVLFSVSSETISVLSLYTQQYDATQRKGHLESDREQRHAHTRIHTPHTQHTSDTKRRFMRMRANANIRRKRDRKGKETRLLVKKKERKKKKKLVRQVPIDNITTI